MMFLSLVTKPSVRRKIMGYFQVISVLVMALIIIVTVLLVRQKLIDGQHSKAKISGSNMALAYADSMMAGEWDKLALMLKSAKKSDVDLEYAILLGNDGRCVAATEDDLKDKFLNQTAFEKEVMEVKQLTLQQYPQKKGVFEVVLPVTVAGERMGTLRLGYTTKHVYAIIRNIIYSSVAIALLALIIGSIIYYLQINRSIVVPLSKVVGVVQQITQGNLMQKEVVFKSNDEIGQLAEAFAKMVSKLSIVISTGMAEANQLGGAAKQLAEFSEQSATGTNQLKVAVEQISRASSDVAKRTQEASASSAKSQELSILGSKSLNEVFVRFDNIKTSMGQSVKNVENLATRSKDITQIAKVLTGIADQTNLLSLNTAIEAARAGEAGKGFAVLATEIRKLADSSQQEAQRITKIIEDMIKETASTQEYAKHVATEVAQSGELIDRTGKMFTGINQQIENMVAQLRDVAAATEETAAATEELSAQAKQQASGIQELSASTVGLKNASNKLLTTMGQFKTQ